MADDSATPRRGPGGTPGGGAQFLVGLILAVSGGYLLLNQVQVTSGGWYLWGTNAFGLSLVPFLLGIGFLFFDGKSILGWLLTLSGAAIIFFGILTHLDIYFRPTSLFNTLLMLVMFVGGLGLLARSLREAPAR
jgi:hypothetical protein